MPLNKLVGFTSDRASVMISPKNGVLGKLRCRRSQSYFLLTVHHINLFWLLTKGKESCLMMLRKRFLTLCFFEDSPVRRDEFKKLKEIVDPAPAPSTPSESSSYGGRYATDTHSIRIKHNLHIQAIKVSFSLYIVYSIKE